MKFGGTHAAMAGPSGMGGAAKSDDFKYARMEAGIPETLYPGATPVENTLRLGFIRKVYGILSAQMVLTAIVSGFVALTPGVQGWIAANPGLHMLSAFMPIITLVPLMCYRNQHPLNLGLLTLFTLAMAFSVGIITSMFSGVVVFQALLITAVVTTSLTIYTFVGVRKGQDFGYLGPMCFAGIMTMLVGGLVFSFFPVGADGRFIFALFGAGLFSTYIVYDTNELILRHSVDEYVSASVSLYLDIINLFIKLLQILQHLQGGRD